jgi:hypothetical protein
MKSHTKENLASNFLLKSPQIPFEWGHFFTIGEISSRNEIKKLKK